MLVIFNAPIILGTFKYELGSEITKFIFKVFISALLLFLLIGQKNKAQ